MNIEIEISEYDLKQDGEITLFEGKLTYKRNFVDGNEE